MSRTGSTFDRIKTEGRKALTPFITAPDPGKEYTVPLMHMLLEEGVGIIELGMP